MSSSSSAAHNSDATQQIASAETFVENIQPRADAPTPSFERLGRYRVLHRIGEGGMGVVELAYDPELDRRVALKWLRRSAKGEDAQRILREARAVAQMAHPNVVTVHDVGVHEGILYIAMEYVEGQDLTQWFHDHPNDPKAVIDVMLQAGQGLAAAHDAGLIHRDFKPSNVLVGTDGRVRVLDFGLAKANETTFIASAPPNSSEEVSLSNSYDPLTVEGTVMGTPLYMAPEQHMSADVDRRADIYSFFLVLYEGLMGTRAFSARSLTKLVIAKRRRSYRPLNVGPRKLRTLMEAGLAPEPELRPGTMKEVLSDLRRTTNRRWRGIAAGLTAGIGLVGFAWAMSSDASTCEQHASAFDGLWDDDARARVRTAFEATDAGFATSMADRTSEALDRYAQSWVDQRVALCEGQTESVQSPREKLLAEVCLESRREEFSRTVQTLESADAKTVARSLETVRSLPEVVHCLESTENADTVVVEHVARRISDARLESLRGDFEGAEESLRQARVEAQSGDYVAGRIEADTQLAAMLLVLDRTEEAKDLLEAAALDAETIGDDRRASRAYLELAYAVGVRGTDTDSARRWLELAERKQKRVHRGDRLDPDASLRLFEYGAMVEHQAGNFAAAEAIANEALGSVEQFEHHGRDGRWALLQSLGAAVLAQGRPDEAIEAYEMALARAQESLGEGHPVLNEVRSNLAAGYLKAGKHEEAITQFESVIEEIETFFGPQHPTLIGTLSNLASSYRAVGRLDDSRKAFERAEVLTLDDAEVTEIAMAVQINLAGLELVEGNHRLAAQRLERAEAKIVATWGPKYPRLVHVWIRQAEVQQALERFDEGIATLDKALALFDEKFRPTDPMRGYALFVKGSILLDGERALEAIEPLEAAVEILTLAADSSDLPAAKDALSRARKLSR